MKTYSTKSFLAMSLRKALKNQRDEKKSLDQLQKDEAYGAGELVDLTNALRHARTDYLKRALREMIRDTRDELNNIKGDRVDVQAELKRLAREIDSIKKEMK